MIIRRLRIGAGWIMYLAFNQLKYYMFARPYVFLVEADKKDVGISVGKHIISLLDQHKLINAGVSSRIKVQNSYAAGVSYCLIDLQGGKRCYWDNHDLIITNTEDLQALDNKAFAKMLKACDQHVIIMIDAAENLKDLMALYPALKNVPNNNIVNSSQVLNDYNSLRLEAKTCLIKAREIMPLRLIKHSKL